MEKVRYSFKIQFVEQMLLFLGIDLQLTSTISPKAHELLTSPSTGSSAADLEDRFFFSHLLIEEVF